MSYHIIRMKEVMAKAGIARTNLWRQVKDGQFPAPVSLGARAVGWVESEVDAWIESKIAERDAGDA